MMHTISSHAYENRMTPSAVAACMAPLLLRPLLAGECELEDNFDTSEDNSAQLLAAANAANNAQAIIATLLEEYDNIFDVCYFPLVCFIIFHCNHGVLIHPCFRTMLCSNVVYQQILELTTVGVKIRWMMKISQAKKMVTMMQKMKFIKKLTSILSAHSVEN